MEDSDLTGNFGQFTFDFLSGNETKVILLFQYDFNYDNSSPMFWIDRCDESDNYARIEEFRSESLNEVLSFFNSLNEEGRIGMRLLHKWS